MLVTPPLSTHSYAQIVVLSLLALVELSTPSHVDQERYVVMMEPVQRLMHAFLSQTAPTQRHHSAHVMHHQHQLPTRPTHTTQQHTLPVYPEMQPLKPYSVLALMYSWRDKSHPVEKHLPQNLQQHQHQLPHLPHLHVMQLVSKQMNLSATNIGYVLLLMMLALLK